MYGEGSKTGQFGLPAWSVEGNHLTDMELDDLLGAPHGQAGADEPRERARADTTERCASLAKALLLAERAQSTKLASQT